VRWERLSAAVTPELGSLGALAGDLARRIERLPRAADEQLAVCIELEGESPLARELRSPEGLRSLAEDVALRSDALEIELRAGGLRTPFDRARLAADPSVLATALALIERAHTDDALLAELAPEELAHDPGPEQLAYLRGLLAGLPEELILRGVDPDGA
jgi:hypothetical protein